MQINGWFKRKFPPGFYLETKPGVIGTWIVLRRAADEKDTKVGEELIGMYSVRHYVRKLRKLAWAIYKSEQ